MVSSDFVLWVFVLLFSNDIHFAAQSDHFVALVFDLKQSCGPFIVVCVLCATGPGKTMTARIRLSIGIRAKTFQTTMVLFSHGWFDDFI